MDVYPRVRGLLLQCEPLGSNRALKDIFVDERLYAWRHGLPEADNELERAEGTIAYLHDKFSPQNEWGIYLLLLVLRDGLETGMGLQRELRRVAAELEPVNQNGSVPALPAGWQATSPAQLDRRRIMNNVRQTWIAGVLEQSLAAEVRLELGMAYRPDALRRDMVYRQPNNPDQSVPAGTGILALFEQSGRSLLILGEPGSGKTFTLLELARDLLDVAERHPEAALPLVFNLASWARERKPLAEWLVEEMLAQYQVPRRRGRKLLEEGQLDFLLDGLDEVEENYRDDCVRALNAFFADHLAGVVVCSRRAEFEALNEKMNLGSAIFIRPLNEQQVEQYLQEAGLEAVAAVRETAAGLEELTESPLMLNMMALAYRDLDEEELAGLDSPAAFQRHLFHTYTERMFYHRYEPTAYPPEQARGWLTWMAQKMVQHNQSIFDVFRMQADWLDPAGERLYWLGVALLGGFLTVIISIPLMDLWTPFFLFPWTAIITSVLLSLIAMVTMSLSTFRPGLKKKGGLIFGLTFGVSFSLIFGVSFGLIFGLAGWFFDTACRLWAFMCGWQRFMTGLISGMIFGLSDGKIFEFSFWISEGLISLLGDGIIDGLYLGLIFGLSGALVDWLIKELGQNIQGVEIISWSPMRGLIFGMSFGLIFGLVSGLIFGTNFLLNVTAEDVVNLALIYGLRDGLGIGLIGGLVVTLVAGLQHRETVENPARGWRSIGKHLWGLAWRVIVTVFVVFVAISLLYSLATAGLTLIQGKTISDVFNQAFSETNFVIWILGIPFLGGIAAGLLYGGLMLLRHLYLRLRIHRSGYLPRQLDGFLEEMVDILLLRRAGGGYIFMHRLLMEYLAETGE